MLLLCCTCCIQHEMHPQLYAGQPNAHTGLIDGHPIYSGSAAGEASLRNGDSCLLLVTPNPEGTNGDFLPLGTDSPGNPEDTEIFLVAGDRRVNEHSVLTTMHTVRPHASLSYTLLLHAMPFCLVVTSGLAASKCLQYLASYHWVA